MPSYDSLKSSQAACVNLSNLIRTCNNGWHVSTSSVSGFSFDRALCWWAILALVVSMPT